MRKISLFVACAGLIFITGNALAGTYYDESGTLEYSDNCFI